MKRVMPQNWPAGAGEVIADRIGYSRKPGGMAWVHGIRTRHDAPPSLARR